MNKKIIFPLLCAFLLAGCNSNNNSNSESNNSNSQVMSIDDNLKTLLEGNLELNGSYTKTGTKHQLNVSFYNDTYVLKDTSNEAILVDKYVKKSDGIYKETVTKNNDLTYKLYLLGIDMKIHLKILTKLILANMVLLDTI